MVGDLDLPFPPLASTTPKKKAKKITMMLNSTSIPICLSSRYLEPRQGEPAQTNTDHQGSLGAFWGLVGLVGLRRLFWIGSLGTLESTPLNIYPHRGAPNPQKARVDTNSPQIRAPKRQPENSQVGGDMGPIDNIRILPNMVSGIPLHWASDSNQNVRSFCLCGHRLGTQ